ncbi:hypothetical protein H4P12_11630 [Paracoccus sp. 11-3]|uniref:Uncharacterized protein n=1 Tax=Paracoccus amoyensis TaxID=2760093 RepID=A0A926JDA3_9RHOB|nr:hypothetical protein [Paracoccus amoyensis]MBC9247344.1 hypothetical protein [Paracoccus amoyensis]
MALGRGYSNVDPWKAAILLQRFTYLALILCVVMTSIGLGVARGTVMIGGQIVLCTGDGVVVVDDPSAPGTIHTHICPDMALSLLSGALPDHAALPDRLAHSLHVAMQQQAALVSREVPSGIARAPPTL